MILEKEKQMLCPESARLTFFPACHTKKVRLYGGIMKKRIFTAPFVTVLLAAVFSLFACREDDRLLSVDRKGQTVVERFGQLRVEGTRLLTADGRPVQLRGISSHGLQWAGKYANE
jgi:hypothetical protein